jgi:hypothetical protein
VALAVVAAVLALVVVTDLVGVPLFRPGSDGGAISMGKESEALI